MMLATPTHERRIMSDESLPSTGELREIDWQALNAPVIEKFREGTDPDASTFHGMPIILLTTTGRKSGTKHTTPLVVESEGDRHYIIASKGGAPKHPTWYLNLRANPEVTVEHGGGTYRATAVEVDEAERDRIFAKVAGKFSNFAEYEAATDRKIPVVELVRKD
jgi:deazaflavin-dependent oxidoreductase (nitroreductase family)